MEQNVLYVVNMVSNVKVKQRALLQVKQKASTAGDLGATRYPRQVSVVTACMAEEQYCMSTL